MTRIYSPRKFTRFMQEKMSVLVFIIIVSALGSCKKTSFDGSPGVLAVFNAIDDQVNLYTNFSGSPDFSYSTANMISNKQFQPGNHRYKIISNPQPLALYATTDTLPKDAPVLKLDLTVNDGDIYSLFVYGPKDNAKHTLLKESIPGVQEKDSLTHVRFINLSGYPNISLNIFENAPGSLVDDLPYEQNSGFIRLDADHSVSGYTFEARDKNTGLLLASFAVERINNFDNIYNGWFNRSNTLVFAGKPGGTGTNVPQLYLMANR